MNENTCCYKRLAFELGITDEKARGYMREYEEVATANVTTARMDEIISDIVKSGREGRPVRKPGRPVVIKEGCIGKRMNKTITMDLEIDRIIEKYTGKQSVSGVIEDAVLLYDKIVLSGVAPEDVVSTLAEGSAIRTMIGKCKELLTAIRADECQDAMMRAGFLLDEINDIKENA